MWRVFDTLAWIVVASIPFYIAIGFLIRRRHADLEGVRSAQRVQNLVYPVVIEPLETNILVYGKAVPLAPGMTVTVEIKTGQRRILEYLFSSLAEVASGAMKET